MNVIEGARRLRVAGRWLVFIPVGGFALFLCLSLVSSLFRIGAWDGMELFRLFVLLLITVVPGTVLWLAGWFLEGFAKDPH
jgi:hypothetical protein